MTLAAVLWWFCICFYFSASVENAFASDEGPFDYVVNFAAETKYGQSEPVCMTDACSPNLSTYFFHTPAYRFSKAYHTYMSKLIHKHLMSCLFQKKKKMQQFSLLHSICHNLTYTRSNLIYKRLPHTSSVAFTDVWTLHLITPDTHTSSTVTVFEPHTSSTSFTKVNV